MHSCLPDSVGDILAYLVWYLQTNPVFKYIHCPNSQSHFQITIGPLPVNLSICIAVPYSSPHFYFQHPRPS